MRRKTRKQRRQAAAKRITTEAAQKEIQRRKAEVAMKEADRVESSETKADSAINKVFAHGNILEPEAKKNDKYATAKDEKAARTRNAIKKTDLPIASDLDGIDADEARIKKLMLNPCYYSRRDRNGHYIIAESKSSHKKIIAYGEGGRPDLTSCVYVYAQTHKRTGVAHRIPLSNIRRGGTALTKFLESFEGVEFSEAEIRMAGNRLWLLVMLGKLDMVDLEEKLDAQGVHAFFLRYIDKELSGGNSKSVYVEQVNGRIDVGIWNDDYHALWESLKDKTDIDERAWAKHAKAIGWLLPDKGRGGGDHNPSLPRCTKYDRKLEDRIQRFAVPEAQAKKWMQMRDLQIMIG
jgi:hypothetical protein